MSHANLYPVGLPGIPPANFRYQRLWYTVVTIGQLLHRLVRPYERECDRQNLGYTNACGKGKK